MRSTPLVVLAFLSVAAGATYEGYKTYKVVVKTESENAYLKSLEPNPELDFWSPINKLGKPVTVMVSPKEQKEFEDNLTTSKISFEIIIDNVESTIHSQRKYHKSKSPLKKGRIAFDQYLRHDEINAYLAQLAEDYPGKVTVTSIGQSYENRSLNAIRISSGVTDRLKPVLFLDAGIHAREWIAPAVALYLIYQLVENEENQPLIQDLDWIILPSLNPDGYEYTWDHDRLWRKTMSRGIRCNGVDGNRNFDYHWMEAGASDDQCSESFGGSKAFSEVETQNLRDFLLKNVDIKAYLSLHSYGQYVLYPWSYADVLPDNADELQEVGEQINDAIKAVNGTEYTVGSTTKTLYAAAGASHDWAMGVDGIDLAFSMELPGGGWIGFDMPASEIERVAAETFEGFKVFGQYVASNRG